MTTRRRKDQRPLTPLELRIMKILWDRGPSNVQTVQKALAAPLAYTTVQTMLNVLHRKGRVKRTLQGRAYDYEAVLSREKATGNALRDVVDRVFGGSVDALLMTLVRTKQLDAVRLAKLRRLVESSNEGERGGKP
jgi:BlaI family transcriptional regulator, penicillinase repressor